MTPLVITLYGHCCRRLAVGQQVVSDISTVRSCWCICSLCSESKNSNLLLCCSMMYSERLFCFKYETQLALQHGGVHLVTIDTEFSDVTAPFLYQTLLISFWSRLIVSDGWQRENIYIADEFRRNDKSNFNPNSLNCYLIWNVFLCISRLWHDIYVILLACLSFVISPWRFVLWFYGVSLTYYFSCVTGADTVQGLCWCCRRKMTKEDKYSSFVQVILMHHILYSTVFTISYC